MANCVQLDIVQTETEDYVYVHSQFDWSVFPELRSNNGHVKSDEICKGHDILVHLAVTKSA